MHAGLDFTASIGTEIYATGDGVVELAKWNAGYGRCVVIRVGYKTKYAHCKKLNCRKGQKRSGRNNCFFRKYRAIFGPPSSL